MKPEDQTSDFEKIGAAPSAVAAAALSVAGVAQRHVDRGGGDNDDDGPLPQFVRFNDLRRAGVARTRKQIKQLVERHGFPSGILLSPNVRAWRVAEIKTWLRDRPVERKVMPENAHRPAKKSKANKRKATAAAAAA
jgi:predicted DNA-binding transcriptional regulator AlpA